jgi:hypothetical protein
LPEAVAIGDLGGEYGGRPLINPTVASQGEMWLMLMQIIPSADAIGQTERKASNGARTFVTPVAFTHLSRASGSGSEGWKTRRGRFLAQWTTCSPEPLCDLKDNSRRWQDIENEIPIAQCGRRILAVFAHRAHALLKRRPQAPAATSRASLGNKDGDVVAMGKV